MVESEVGTEGHMGSDPDWPWGRGSDKEEDSSSVTTVSDSFRYDYTLGYNIYALAFDIKRNNNLGYQYAYTTIRYRTRMERTSVDLSQKGKTHLSAWMRCVGCSHDVIVSVKIFCTADADQWHSSIAPAGTVGAEWRNYKVFFDEKNMANVESFDFIIEEEADGVLELTHVSGSTGTPYTEMPVLVDGTLL